MNAILIQCKKFTDRFLNEYDASEYYISLLDSRYGSPMDPVVLGTLETGFLGNECERDCLEYLKCVTRRSQSTDACYYCPIASGCSWCSAYNYQSQGSVDKRATYICEMHKACVLALVYYWNSYFKKKGLNRHVELWVPRQWAVPIICDKEYSELCKLTMDLGGYVKDCSIDSRLLEKQCLIKTDFTQNGKEI